MQYYVRSATTGKWSKVKESSKPIREVMKASVLPVNAVLSVSGGFPVQLIVRHNLKRY